MERQKQRDRKTEGDIKFSHAPYNFVPLNTTVIPAEDLPDFDRYYPDRYTGYIDLEIKALTPLYIRDTLTEEEYREKEEHENYSNPSFFMPGGVVRIPGSSLRGMIRTLVEIVSYGRFVFFDDKRLYFRFITDKHLRDYYRERIANVKAGILKKVGFDKFVIKESKYEKREDTSRKEVICRVKDGWMVYSGSMNNKRHNWFIKDPEPGAKEFEVDYNRVIRTYLDDSARKSKINLIEELKKKEFANGVPCFFCVDEQGKVTAIGHTKNMRLPYSHTIGDVIKRQMSSEGPEGKATVRDIPSTIFGDEKTCAGRVFFEDAYAENPHFYETGYPKILSSPKPTCIQHYLKQKDQRLLHYDSQNSTIRGYKLYWHRDGNKWVETDEENIKRHESQYTRITPVKEGTIFRGRIRFENLTMVELGALLFVLDLPEGLAHKIGMGKPLGLGSIRITPRLYLSDRQRRYSDLFEEWDGLKEANGEVAKFKKEFERYILKNLNEKKQSLWEVDRIKTLRIMLDWEGRPSSEKTEYLELKRFKDRPILPAPEQVIKRS